MVSLLCGHSEPFLGTWPSSGMTRDGSAFELPTPALPTGVTESSLLRTPVADETGGGPLHPDTAKERGQTLRLTGQILAHTGHLLPTPEAKLAHSGPDYARPNRAGSGGHDLTTAVHLLPTPAAANPNEGESLQGWQKRRARVKAEKKNGNGFGMPLGIAVRLLGEPSSQPSDDGNQH